MLQVVLPDSPARGAARLSWQICERVDDIDRAAWERVCRPGDWGMALTVLAVQQSALADQARCWFALVRDANGTPLAAAALALFRVDVIQSQGTLARLAAGTRRLVPGFLKMKVLFCGLPVPCGGHHLRLVEEADAGAVLAFVERRLMDLARQQGARLVVFKELGPAQEEMARGLAGLGYVRGDVPPNYHLRRMFGDIEAYRAAVRADYRRALAVAHKKFAALGLSVSHHGDPAEITRRFDDRLYGLYLHVWNRSAYRLECFPPAFFRELPSALPGQVVLSIMARAGTPVAFGYGVMVDRHYHSLYLGYDGALNRAGSLYFNITFQCLDWAFRNGAREITLGQTGDEAKVRLGAAAERLCFMVRPPNPLLQRGLKAFAGQIFPSVEPRPVHHVFANPDGRLAGGQNS